MLKMHHPWRSQQTAIFLSIRQHLSGAARVKISLTSDKNYLFGAHCQKSRQVGVNLSVVHSKLNCIYSLPPYLILEPRLDVGQGVSAQTGGGHRRQVQPHRIPVRGKQNTALKRQSHESWFYFKRSTKSAFYTGAAGPATLGPWVRQTKHSGKETVSPELVLLSKVYKICFFLYGRQVQPHRIPVRSKQKLH